MCEDAPRAAAAAGQSVAGRGWPRSWAPSQATQRAGRRMLKTLGWYETLGQASRVPGVTPAAVSLLLVHLKKGRLKALLSDAA